MIAKAEITAYFVMYPRMMKDLQKPHLISDERTYEVVEEINLAAIDYENFITDLCVDRQFIEDHAARCSEGEPMQCLLVRSYGRSDGVAVVPAMPDDLAFVRWAAYIKRAVG